MAVGHVRSVVPSLRLLLRPAAVYVLDLRTRGVAQSAALPCGGDRDRPAERTPAGTAPRGRATQLRGQGHVRDEPGHRHGCHRARGGAASGRRLVREAEMARVWIGTRDQHCRRTNRGRQRAGRAATVGPFEMAAPPPFGRRPAELVPRSRSGGQQAGDLAATNAQRDAGRAGRGRAACDLAGPDRGRRRRHRFALGDTPPGRSVPGSVSHSDCSRRPPTSSASPSSVTGSPPKPLPWRWRDRATRSSRPCSTPSPTT